MISKLDNFRQRLEEIFMYVEEELVFFKMPIKNQNELFDFISDKLEEKNYVTDTFREAIKRREKEFPTGLALENMNLAIVHTEAEYAKVDKLIILQPKEAIPFKNIENHEPLEVDLVIGLILHNSEKHLSVLKKLSEILQNNKIIQILKNIETKGELYMFMKKHFNTPLEEEEV